MIRYVDREASGAGQSQKPVLSTFGNIIFCAQVSACTDHDLRSTQQSLTVSEYSRQFFERTVSHGYAKEPEENQRLAGQNFISKYSQQITRLKK